MLWKRMPPSNSFFIVPLIRSARALSFGFTRLGHAYAYAVRAELPYIFRTGILAAPVRMMDEVCIIHTVNALQGCLKRLQGIARIQCGAYAPTDYLLSGDR